MQFVEESGRAVIRLDDGQELHPSLAEIAKRHGIRAATIVSGVGMLRRAEVGYWNGREYQPQRLEAPHELLSLQGSIAEADGQPSIHLHVTLGGPDHRVVGGHLMSGTIGVLAEITLATFPGRVFGRPLNESLGLRALDLEPGPNP